MFSGIIRNQAKIINLIPNSKGAELIIENVFDQDFLIGDSILVNGVCLTVTKFDEKQIHFDLLFETLEVSNLQEVFSTGGSLNLELSLRVGDFNHGSQVTGHVDTTVKFIENQGEKYFFTCNSDIVRFLQAKNYVILNGVCLTLVDVSEDRFSVCLIPETLNATNLSDLQAGEVVNLEYDNTARIVVNFLENYYLNKT